MNGSTTITSTPGVAGASRWALAAVAATAVLAIGIGVVLGGYLVNLRGGVQTLAADHVPADAMMYVEVRLDLPGGQRARLIEISDRFPGMDLEQWLDEDVVTFLDDAMDDARLDVSYSTDVAPWLSGAMAVAILDLPAQTDPFLPPVPEVIAYLGVTDAAAAAEFSNRVRDDFADSGISFTSRDAGGVEVWSVDGERSTGLAPMGSGFAYAVTDRLILFAETEERVVAALDAGAGRSGRFSDRSELRDLGSRLAPDPAFVVAGDMDELLEQSIADLALMAPELAETYRSMLADQATFGMVAGYVEDGRLRLTAVAPAPTGEQALANGRRTMAELVPADALFFADGGDIGRTWSTTATSLEAMFATMPGAEEVAGQLDQLEMTLGSSLADLLAWAGDGALVAGWDGREPYAAVLLVADDEDAARLLLGRVGGLLGLARSDPNVAASLKIETSTVGETLVTSVRFVIPPEAGMAGDAAVEYAIHDGVVLIAAGEGVVRRIVELEAGESLESNERFRAARAAVDGGESVGLAYLDLDGTRRAIEAAFADELGPEYAAEVRGYLEPLGHLVTVTRVDGGTVRSEALIVLD